MHWIYHVIRDLLIHWGYWAILAGLLAEDAGLPMPGETVLMFASFLAHKSTHLQLGWIIVVGTCAAIFGDNLGYWAGRWLGPHFLRWLGEHFKLKQDIDAARDQIRHHGPATIFWARYIFGLRTIAGPVAVRSIWSGRNFSCSTRWGRSPG